MLQVARLAPSQLGDSSSLVAAFLQDALTLDGGFPDRAGATDLYYTVFGLEGLIALQATLPADRVAPYLTRFGDGAGLDFVHLACLARAWAALGVDRMPPLDGVIDRLEQYRSADGAYAQTPGAPRGSVYACYLALGVYQDLQVPLPDPAAMVAAVQNARCQDGAYGNRAGDVHGITTTTAAAVLMLRELDAEVDPHLGMWLLDRCDKTGGFQATPSAPVPDLLSTATALHSLAALQVPIDGLQEPCLDFVDSLWTNRGGFYGNWMDDTLDCEYTYYGLLTLGHLALLPGA
ncbi:MAG: prenyltransferase/squalene oxidase repeat-containing protein [Acidobacteriota bacterium]